MDVFHVDDTAHTQSLLASNEGSKHQQGATGGVTDVTNVAETLPVPSKRPKAGASSATTMTQGSSSGELVTPTTAPMSTAMRCGTDVEEEIMHQHQLSRHQHQPHQHQPQYPPVHSHFAPEDASDAFAGSAAASGYPNDPNAHASMMMHQAGQDQQQQLPPHQQQQQQPEGQSVVLQERMYFLMSEMNNLMSQMQVHGNNMPAPMGGAPGGMPPMQQQQQQQQQQPRSQQARNGPYASGRGGVEMGGGAFNPPQQQQQQQQQQRGGAGAHGMPSPYDHQQQQQQHPTSGSNDRNSSSSARDMGVDSFSGNPPHQQQREQQREMIVVLVEFKRQRIKKYEALMFVQPGTYVVVDGDRGYDCGFVVQCCMRHADGSVGRTETIDNVQVDINKLKMENGKVRRVAEQNEVNLLHNDIASLERNALKTCRERVEMLGMDIEIVDCEYQFDRKKVTFYFDSEVSVDFRDLTKDLYRIFNTRIWLENINTKVKNVVPEGALSHQDKVLYQERGLKWQRR